MDGDDEQYGISRMTHQKCEYHTKTGIIHKKKKI